MPCPHPPCFSLSSGANRLNNSAGNGLSIAALACVTVAVIALLTSHRHFSEGTICACLYTVSLTLLLMTSLRGWSITGHDIQTEYRVFQLTAAHGRWNISYFHSAYNACLSITILPTEMSRMINVDHPYIYKFFFQAIFALCPMLVYILCRRFGSSYGTRLVALLAAIYFLGFPTYFGDMPFLNRQEIAFLFVCIAALSATNKCWKPRVRRFTFLISAAGVELSHYSTMYLLLGTVAIAWIAACCPRIWELLASRARASSAATSRRPNHSTVGLGSVLILAAMVVLWGGIATGTSAPVVSEVATAIGQLGHSNSATTYSVLSRRSLNASQVLSDYRTATLRQNANTPGSLYLPAALVARYATPLLNEPPLRLTALGRLASRSGVSISTLNSDIRQGAAKDEQLFLAAGFLAFVLSRKLRRSVNHQLVYLAFGSVVMVGIFTIFPALSIDYGALRAFQESLILAAPLLVIGSVVLFSLLSEKWGVRISAAVCMVFFISTIGLLPQVLGGYPAQLSLNNSGQYYDIYYVHPQDEAAVAWLAGKPGVVPTGLQAPLGPGTSDLFAFSAISDVNGRQFVDDVYPALIERSSWVLLDYSIVHSDRAPLSFDGDLLTYAYPKQLLENSKNLVYNNGGAEIYK